MPKSIATGKDGEIIIAEGIGDIHLQTADGILVLKDVWYAPDLSENLVSIAQLTKEQMCLVFHGDQVKVYDDPTTMNLVGIKSYEVLLQVNASGDLYRCIHLPNCWIWCPWPMSASVA